MRLSIVFGLGLVAATSAHGGADPVSYSSVPGLFLGQGDQIYIPADSPEDHQRQLKALCAAGGSLWRFGSTTPSKCTEFRYHSGVDVPEYVISIKPGVADWSLFSVHPFGAHKWVERTATASERETLAAVLRRVPEYKEALDKLQKGLRVVAIDAMEAGDAEFILPWKLVVQEESGTNENFVAVIRVKGKYGIAGDFAGRYRLYPDVNSDGLADLYVSTACDGICDGIYSLSPTVKSLVSVSNH